MTEVLKMSICGIRSYQNPDTQYIEFVKPLTMILGQNGSGKTTIIECLKLMTCGELPSSSQQGRHFVADPALTNSTETRGNVKLMFKAVNGRQILASRQLQVGLNKNKYCFKTIESCLKTKNREGQEVSINHTCIEMDQQVIDLIGVSKVVLDKVIFCHQEDTFWMFQDSAALSSVFEQLFDTKDFISHAEVLKNHFNKNDKQAKEDDKLFKALFSKPAKDYHKELIQLMVSTDKYQHDLNLVNYKLREEGGNQVPHLRQQSEQTKKKLNIAQHQLDQMQISDQILEKVYDLAQLQDNKESQEKSIHELLQRKAENEQYLHSSNQKIFEINEQMLKLSTGRSDYMELEKQGQRLKRQLNSLLNKEEEDLPTLLQACTRQLVIWSDRSSDKDIAYYLATVSGGEQALQELEDKVRTTSANLKLKKADLAKADTLRGLLAELRRDLRESKQKMQEEEDRLARLQDQRHHCSIRLDKEQEKERMAQESILRLDTQLARAEVRTLRRAQRHQNTLIEQEVAEMLVNINSLANQKQVLMLKHPQHIDEEALKEQRQRLKTEMAATHRDIQKTLLQLEIMDQQVLDKEELEEQSRAIRAVYEHEYISRETQRQKREGRCGMCRQPVRIDILASTLTRQMEREEQIEAYRECLRESGFNPFQMEDKARQRDVLVGEQAELDRLFQKQKEEMVGLESQIQAKEQLLVIQQQMAHLDKDKEAKQKQIHSIEQDSNDDVDDKHLVKLKKEQLDRQRTACQDSKRYAQEISSLDQQIRKVELQILENQSGQDMKYKVIDSHLDFIKGQEGRENWVVQSEMVLQQAQEDREKAQEALQRNKDSLREREVRLESDRNMLQFQSNELKANLQQKRDLNTKDFERQSKKQLKALGQSLGIAQNKKQQFEEEQTEIEEQLDKQQLQKALTEQSIQEGIQQKQYREQEQLVNRLNIECKDMQEQLDDEEEKQRGLEGYRTEKQVLEERLGSLYSRLKVLRRESAEQDYGWEKDGMYARKMFQEQSRLIADDLQTMFWQMDLIVLDMHQKKIKQINTLIHDYWSRIYQGEDVKTIQVVATQEQQGTNKRRMYKYQVKQVVSYEGREVSQEMKGRCSMGQKVLASIVIRLALAEAFSGHSQFMALDEPTTNLDRNTIDSLSHQIATLIRIKKRVSNFQILLITHDLQFIQGLKRALEDHHDNYQDTVYYEVRKEPTGSKIYRRNMRDL